MRRQVNKRGKSKSGKAEQREEESGKNICTSERMKMSTVQWKEKYGVWTCTGKCIWLRSIKTE